MADWGADVVMIEHPIAGAGRRGLRRLGPVTLEGFMANAAGATASVREVIAGVIT